MTTPIQWLEDNLLSEPWAEEHFEHNYECWDKAKAMEKDMMLAIIESYHNNMFYLPLKDGEAEKILELMQTGQIKPQL